MFLIAYSTEFRRDTTSNTCEGIIITVTQAKIVCTIGPAVSSDEKLAELVEAGMNVARLNLSHSTLEKHRDMFHRIRKIAPEVAIMFDLAGPKIRLGDFEGVVQLCKDQHVTLITDGEPDVKKLVFPLQYKALPKEVETNGTLFINDGVVELKVLETTETRIECKVLAGGPVSARKGVNAPGAALSMRAPTPKDLAAIDALADLDPDFVSVSFVRSEHDIQKVREAFAAHDVFPHVISKIEHAEGVEDIDDIIHETDGIMIARGDLGVEIPAEEVPFIQKAIIRQALAHAIPVIVATQMLESMVTNSVPTRAETSDVTNAVIDGTDAVMLSAETSAGQHPIKSVRVMKRIVATAARRFLQDEIIYHIDDDPSNDIPENVGFSACALSCKLEADAILCITSTGYSAQMVSKFRPPVPIIAACAEEGVRRKLQLLWGTMPVAFETSPNAEQRIKNAVKATMSAGLLTEESLVIIVMGNILGKPSRSASMLVHKVSDLV